MEDQTSSLHLVQSIVKCCSTAPRRMGIHLSVVCFPLLVILFAHRHRYTKISLKLESVWNGIVASNKYVQLLMQPNSTYLATRKHTLQLYTPPDCVSVSHEQVPFYYVSSSIVLIAIDYGASYLGTLSNLTQPSRTPYLTDPLETRRWACGLRQTGDATACGMASNYLCAKVRRRTFHVLALDVRPAFDMVIGC